MEPPDELLDCSCPRRCCKRHGSRGCANGDDASVVLESALGITRIEGETVVSTFQLGIPEMPQFPVLYQGGARYRWDGEDTYGMLERSSMRDKLTAPAGCWSRIFVP